MHRRFLSIVLALSTIFAPLAASARSITEIVNVRSETVTRANFLRWTIEALGLPTSDACTLPYVRVPRRMKGTLCTAQTVGALSVLTKTKNLSLGKPVTRGEAIQIISLLMGKHARADVSKYGDLKTEPEKQAVMNALEFKWMVPESGSTFGMAKPLTGTESLSVLQAVSGQSVLNIIVPITTRVERTDESLPHQDLLQTIWQLIVRDYLYSDRLKPNEASYEAIQGLVNSLKDPYAAFFPPVDATGYQSQLKGEVSGIGAHVEDRGGIITIVAPLNGSPAERAGILPGDEILKADGVALTGLQIDKAVSYIRGEKGTTVELLIRRSGSEMTVRIQREIVTIPEIQVTWHGTIAVVGLMQFGDTTSARIRDILTEVRAQQPKGIVLDLRNNPGGLLSAAGVVTSNFVPEGTVFVEVKSRAEKQEQKTVEAPTIDVATKMVVLVNKGSASASEIVAGALQDHRRATIVGTTTFGKGTVQEFLTFRGGEALKFTVAEWFTPLGRKIDGIGIEPDITIEKDDTRDNQLQKALDILR